MQIKNTDFLLQTVFRKHQCADGSVIYWRDCALKEDMQHGEQGYLWVFEDGETFHSYRTPEQCL